MRQDAAERRACLKNLGCEADGVPKTALLDAELLAGVGAEAFGGPGGSPHHIYSRVADAGQLLEARFYLRADVDVLGAALRSQSQIDGDILFVFRRRDEHDRID